MHRTLSNLSVWVSGLGTLGLACGTTTPPNAALQPSTPAAAVFEERTVILTEPPGATIVVDAETLAKAAPLVIRHRRETVADVARRVRIRALPRLPDECTQLQIVEQSEPAPDTIRFQMNRCPKREEDFARVFDVDELDQRPSRLRGPMPEYPQSQLRRGVGGKVVLEVVIDTAGRPETRSLHIVEATDTRFVSSATRSVLGTVFTPGRLLGRKVRTRIRIPITYSAR